MTQKKLDIDKGFTHGGIFHADDVFASALLRILNPDIVILRGNVVPEGFDGILYDIGFGKFDHHQTDRLFRQNGIPYAAFGLLWKEFGCLLLMEEDAGNFDEEFVQQIDLADNTGEYCEVSQIIYDFNPLWDEEVTVNERFWDAVDFAQTILNNRIRQIQARRKAKSMVMKFMEEQEGPILIMDQFYPWKDVVCASNKLYVVYPSVRSGYMIQAVPQSPEVITLKKAFPEEWRGKTPKELQESTGISTFSFCHLSGFICAADTIEDAKRVAKLAVEWI